MKRAVEQSMSRKLLAAALAGGAGIIVLALQLETKPVYSLSVSDFLARDLRDEKVKLQGLLVRRTLCRIEAACGYRFTLQDGSLTSAGELSAPAATLSVRYDGCVIPDNFRDIPGHDVTVTVEGERCQTCHDFKAAQIMTRGMGRYEMVFDGGAYVPSAPPPRCDALTPRM
jgi:cytochrome c-type biogenesis protein CcmE